MDTRSPLTSAFRSHTTAAQHIKALRTKGYLAAADGVSRGLKSACASRGDTLLARIPIFGSIPAGFAVNSLQEAEGCLRIDLATLGLRASRNLYALRVRGDSMIEKHILPGDVAVLDHGRTPHPGDVVAALIDNESTLKLYMRQRGNPFLRAANPRYQDLVPATELAVQGVLVGLVRKTL